MKPQIKIGLTGNPNAGKTTIFNGLTGARQKVGNWPGVTVEKKEGSVVFAGRTLKVVDLPGTYSLTPFSIEEVVTRNFILEEKPDVVIDVVDATNLERNLYLAVQLREMGCPVLIALNMMDMAHNRGILINVPKLSSLLGIPIVETIGNQKEKLDVLIKKAVQITDESKPIPTNRFVQYSRNIENSISIIMDELACVVSVLAHAPRWVAIKLLENDLVVVGRLVSRAPIQAPEILKKVEQQRERLKTLYDEEPELVFTDERYGHIAGIIKEVQTSATENRADLSQAVDFLLTHKYFGFPIFIFFIWMMFQATFWLGLYPQEWIGSGISSFSSVLQNALPPSILKDLLIDGIIAGVGSVVSFLPNILILFFCIALFEDTGYMARAAFLMDRIMHLIGLHGKSFIPMLMGFGCTVPAIMATRTLESSKDRLLTILITPFMSCSARLPIYIILAGAFFGARAGTVIFAVYLIGVVVSMLSGRLLRSTLLRGEDVHFVMELPPYRLPLLKNLVIHMWDRSKIFLKHMTGIILVGSVIIWALSATPQSSAQIFVKLSTQEKAIVEIQKESTIENSYLGKLGHWIAPVFKPAGIDWQGSVALLTGFVAKEVVVSTMGILYGANTKDTNDLSKALLHSSMTPLSAFSMMCFVLLYLPCVATIAAVYRETGRMKWMFFSMAFSTTVAWVVSVSIYQGGRLLGLG